MIAKVSQARELCRRALPCLHVDVLPRNEVASGDGGADGQEGIFRHRECTHVSSARGGREKERGKEGRLGKGAGMPLRDSRIRRTRSDGRVAESREIRICKDLQQGRAGSGCARRGGRGERRAMLWAGEPLTCTRGCARRTARASREKGASSSATPRPRAGRRVRLLPPA